MPDSPQLRDTGVLSAVSRIGHRLSVTIDIEGWRHVALLHPWVEPPTIDQVHAALRRAVGRSLPGAILAPESLAPGYAEHMALPATLALEISLL